MVMNGVRFKFDHFILNNFNLMVQQEDKDQEDAIAERKRRQREERERIRSRGRAKVRDNDLDPMDPAAYSDIPRFGSASTSRL